MRLALPIALLLFAPACKTVAPFVVAADSLDALGEQFVQTNDAFNKGYASGLVTDDQQEAWASFADRFVLFYRPTMNALRIAKESKNDAEAGRLGVIVARYAEELAAFFAKAQVAGLFKGKPL
jgi:hypothetical protein